MLSARTGASASSPSLYRFAPATFTISFAGTLAELLGLRPRFLGILAANAFSSFSARLARASSRSSKLITFAFSKIIDLIDYRT
ncbi:hypothetical protein COCCADRAFT_113867 [Bipolaris zeicola 26-R-13]|uniref:Uncharacterized protein n=1 Tax=Cochliobolus carbonum (strain 26-R-13) TaxID=930089 RepID=W6Y5N7_COCC2|nr:uncharacterized protein COCCADRAFT_113867 [Bipolaris zeicola 26-R-13]EUC26611.1 hypothetical protein COCCADRAFT_113867 [Bipolaris zeicola 26-R-13]